MTMSKINIIVPVYNVEKYLDEFFESIEKQDFKDFTLIVVDDCSTDSSPTIIARHKEKMGSQMIEVKTSFNSKLYGSRNTGLDCSEQYPSEFTIFLDSDDIIDKTFLSSLYDKAVEDEADITICGMQRFEDETKKIICTEMVNFPKHPVENLSSFDDFAFINTSVCNKLFRSEKIKGIRFRETMRSEDTIFLMEVLPFLERAAFTNKVGYYYRVRRDSLTTGIDQNRLDSMYPAYWDLFRKYKSQEYLPYLEIFQTQAFIRLVLGGVMRVAFNDFSSSRMNIKRALDFLDEASITWRENKYLSFGKERSKTHKQFAIKICSYLIRHNMYWIVFDAYRFYIMISNKEVRL